MSQKTTRRARRQTSDEDPPCFKAPTPKPNGTEESLLLPEEAEQPEQTPQPKEPTPQPKEPTPPPEEPAEKESPQEQEPPVEKETEKIVTRSRSNTPQVKKITNGHDEEEPENITKEEMEPLVITDEPDPELVFEDNSDLECGRESPVLSRCKTRRSLTRNIPTPKTPKVEEDAKLEEEEEADLGEEPEEEFNGSYESCTDNVSTKAEVGGDSTRLNYTESTLECNSFLQEAKNKSFGETLRRLSTRRTIRPISDDFRRRFPQTTVERDSSRTYPTRNSVESVASVGGVKRKNEDGEEEFTKRYKSDSPGFFAKFTSPLASIRSTFRGDVASSTPKLTGYKDEKCQIEEDGVNSQMCEIQDGERRWCSIM